MVCKPILVFSLGFDQAEQKVILPHNWTACKTSFCVQITMQSRVPKPVCQVCWAEPQLESNPYPLSKLGSQTIYLNGQNTNKQPISSIVQYFEKKTVRARMCIDQIPLPQPL